jgi:hypothetical protein
METYRFDMTAAQLKLARWAGRAATKHLAGVKLYEGVKIGEALLIGRAEALRISGAQNLRHKGYALAFKAWKHKFHFPDEQTHPGAKRFYSDAILIAEHKELADRLIGGLPADRKAEMGVFGLAKLVQMNLNRYLKAKDDKQEKSFEPSFGPWESKQVIELRRDFDTLHHSYDALVDEHQRLVAASAALMRVLADLGSLPADVVAAIARWEETWKGWEPPYIFG